MKKKIYLSIVLTLISFVAFSQIPSYLPSNGLVGWWPFNGNANDESGNANNGTNNGATLTTDRFGNANNAYNFDGISNLITVPYSSSLNFSSSPITISFWINLPTYQSNNKANNAIYGASYPSLQPYGFRCWFQGNTSHAFQFYIANGSYSTSRSVGGDSTEIKLNNWTHITCTFDNTTIKYYVNGVLKSQNLSNGTVIGNSTGPIYFGGPNIPNTSTDGYFAGILDDIGIWNRALTQQEITDLFLSSNNVGINIQTPSRNLHVKDVLRLEPRNGSPSNPSKGDIYFDGVLNKLRVYDGTTWQNCW